MPSCWNSKDGQQITIIHFKSHKFKEEVYKKRKTTKSTKVEIKFSLTRTRTKTLNYAPEVTNENLEVSISRLLTPMGI